ncbi:MAG: DUF455 family protein [Candidatus Tectimicrobiota bacterium]
MNPAPGPGLDPLLFAPAPAREARFDVKDHWCECLNFPAGHAQKEQEFLHRQMNEEVNGMEVSGRCLADFPEAEWSLCLSMARQCADEARHVEMFQKLFEKRGGQVGEYPVLNFQYRIITKIETLIGRLAVQNRSFEAEGLDAIQFNIDATRNDGACDMAALYEAQIADEIVHVRFANQWIREAIRADPRNVLRMSAALTAAERAFREVMGTEGTKDIKYQANAEGRLEAGFLPEEVARAITLTAARQATQADMAAENTR